MHYIPKTKNKQQHYKLFQDINIDTQYALLFFERDRI